MNRNRSLFSQTPRYVRAAVGAAILGMAACLARTPPGPDFIIGAQTAPGQCGEDGAELVALARQAGIASLRCELRWEAVEPVKGRCRIPGAALGFFKAAGAAGGLPFCVLGGGNSLYDQGGLPRSPEAIEAFARYAECCVSALKGQCRLFLIGNEWAGGDAREAYARLLGTVYPRLKAIDPGATILASLTWNMGDPPGRELTAWMQGVACDGLGVQLCFGDAGLPLPEVCLEPLRRIAQAVAARRGSGDLPLFITGLEWPSAVGAAGPEDFIARLGMLAKTVPAVKGVWFGDGVAGDRPLESANGGFGLMCPDFTPKPAYFVIKDLASLLVGAEFVRRVPAADPDAWALLFKGADGRDALALWCTAKDDACQFTFATASPAGAKLRMTVVGETAVDRSPVIREWVTKTGLKPEAKVETNRFSATVRGRPLLVAGDLSGLALVKTERHCFPEDARPQNRLVAVPRQVAVARHLGARRPAPAHALATAASSGGTPSAPGAAADVRDARFWVRWNRERLQIVVEIAGAALLPSGVAGSEWRGEGLRLAFQLPGQVPSSPLRLLRFSLRPAPGGLTVFRQTGTAASGGEPVAEAKVSVTRDGRRTRCVLDLPASSLGAPALVSDQVFGFALEIAGQGGADGSGTLCWGGRPDAESGAAMSHWLVLEGEP